MQADQWNDMFRNTSLAQQVQIAKTFTINHIDNGTENMRHKAKAMMRIKNHARTV